jgi:hypothetical protein
MLVRAVSLELRDTIRPHAQDERSGQPGQPKPVAQLIAGVYLRDPDVVLVPLGRDPVRGRAKLAEESANS